MDINNNDRKHQAVSSTRLIPKKYFCFAMGSFIFYLLGFVIIYRLTGFGSSIIAIIPVIVIAWLYGCIPGIFAGLLAAPINIVMYTLLGEEWFGKGILNGTIILGTAAVTFIGAIVGRLRDVSLKLSDVNQNLQEEVKERKAAEKKLMLHQDRLDELVKTRTSELQTANQQLIDREHQLRESSDFIENVFETTGDGIFVTDSQGIIMRANKTFYEMSGYSEKELIGKHVIELSEKSMKKGQKNYVTDQLLTQGVCKGFETLQVKKDGSTYPVELNITTLVDDNKKLIGSVCSVRDISRRREMEVKSRLQQEQLTQSSKMASLGTLVAGIAHEINNPINLITMHNRLNQKVWEEVIPELQRVAEHEPGKTFGGMPFDYINENFGHLIDEVGAAASRVENIVKDLKNFSRKYDFDISGKLNINKTIEDAVKLCYTTVQKAGITLELRLANNLPDVHGNHQKIEQVFINIMINAVEAINHEHGKIIVTSVYDTPKKMVSVKIEDNGSGIASGLVNSIFDPFMTTKQTSGGTGLGLSICYTIIEQHGGTISVDSNIEKGTIFTISFPEKSDK
jgi:PAS domain S-box-containing protein